MLSGQGWSHMQLLDYGRASNRYASEDASLPGGPVLSVSTISYQAA